jgi:uncharacterized protein (UPF0335 family)
MTATHHDARALTKDEGAQLYDHIRAIESLEEEKKEISDDINERKTICCEALPINKDVLNFVLKRRKAGRSTCGNFDTMLELVEEAIHTVEEQRRNAGPALTVRVGASAPADVDDDEEADGEDDSQLDEEEHLESYETDDPGLVMADPY